RWPRPARAPPRGPRRTPARRRDSASRRAPAGRSLRDRVDAREERDGTRRSVAGRERAAPGEIELREPLRREAEHAREPERGLRKERLDQLRRHPERLAQLVEDRAHTRALRRVLRERERRRL